jgi:gliding motility-associated-like protein
VKQSIDETVMNFKLLRLITFGLLLVGSLAYGQAPSNDNCNQAVNIAISNGGFGIGKFKSDTFNVRSATLQSGESFHSSLVSVGNDQKSIWFKFYIPVRRGVSIELTQPASAIGAKDVGFTTYKSSFCLPSSGSITKAKLTPLNQFGSSFHPCLDPGWYIIQVGAKSRANGVVSINMETSFPYQNKFVLNAAYDEPDSCFDFGSLSSKGTIEVGDKEWETYYELGCYTLRDSTEYMPQIGANYKDYSQSAWHTFKTDASVDFVSFEISGKRYPFSSNTIVGFRLYKGKASSGLNTLTLVEDSVVLNIDSFRYQYNAITNFVRFTNTCDLKPNSDYSFQLIFHNAFSDEINVKITNRTAEVRTVSARPNTASMDAKTHLGSISGLDTIDVGFTCDNLMAYNRCGNTNPTDGVRIGNNTYNLSQWYTFKLDHTSKLKLRLPKSTSNYYKIIKARLFKGKITNSCTDLDTTDQIGFLEYNIAQPFEMNCLEPGEYALQVLGIDSLQEDYGGTYHLGGSYSIEYRVDRIININHFALQNSGSIDEINKKVDLKSNAGSVSLTDTFGCAKTLLPADACKNYNRAIYRTFTIGDGDGDGANDSGSVYISSLKGLLQTGNNRYFTWSLYRGNAGSLANSQSVSQYPDTISGLKPIFNCQPQFLNAHSYHTCLTPGTYTFVTQGNEDAIGSSEKLTFSYVKHSLKYDKPSSPEELDTLKHGQVKTSSFVDFTCFDNATTIDGVACGTKMVYRTFYLEKESVVQIEKYSNTSTFVIGLFKGNSKNGVSGLKLVTLNGDPWKCFSVKKSSDCYPLSAGWYTVVSYAVGKNFSDPAGLNSVGNYNSMGVDQSSAVQISVSPAQNFRSRYSKPYKASDVDLSLNSGNPLIWKPNYGSLKFPITTTKFELPVEYLCDADTPSTKHIIDFCDSSITNLTYYVFSLEKESFMKLTDIPSNSRIKLYNLDVRTDSSQFASAQPVQDCNYDNSFIEFCRLKPSTYTLVVQSVKSSKAIDEIQPYMWIDSVGYSRFDFAKKAYDFDYITPNAGFQSGKVGDTNPTNPNMSASQDWFFCTTGASENDPKNDCSGSINPFVYPSKQNTAFFPNDSNYVVINGKQHLYYNTPSRNLWYTFRVKGKGSVTTELKSLSRKLFSIYDNYQNVLSYSIYQSDENGYLDFGQILSQNKLDSTVGQGLSLVAQTLPSRCSNFTNLTTSFKLDECDTATAKRFYVVVNVRYPYQNKFPNLNYNVEFNIKFDDVATPPKARFNHVATAAEIKNIKDGTLATGDSTYFIGSTVDLADSNNLACKSGKNQGSVWYKVFFDTTAYINYRVVRYSRSGTKYLPSSHSVAGENLQLFKANDLSDTLNGFTAIPGTSKTHPSNNLTYVQSCVNKGWYYILVDRCTNWGCFDYIYPEVIVDYQYGDFCTDAIDISLSGLGSKSSSALINCHTIGTDYGEDGSNMGCLFGPSGYKSTWFKVNYSGGDKSDLEFGLKEFTNAKAKDIRYRTYFGNCAALTPGPCNNNSLTSFTIDCIGKGSYYIQVVTPATTTGNIELTATAYKNKDTTCVPIDIFVPTSNFNYTSICPENRIEFVNLSSSGDSISYEWDFGYNNQTSTQKTPQFTYPSSNQDQTFKVLLKAINTSRGTFDTLSKQIIVPFTPSVDILNNDTSICHGESVQLEVKTHGGEPLWSNGSTDSVITVSDSGWYYVDFNQGSNLISNPSGEINLSNGWKIASGSWTLRCGTPAAKEGSCYISGGNSAGLSEIEQEIDVSSYSSEIDKGEAKSSFKGYFQTKNESPGDMGQVVVQYLNGSGIILSSYQSGMTTHPYGWKLLEHGQTIPKNTRKVKIRLIAEQVTGSTTDVYFDDLSFYLNSECGYRDSVHVGIYALPEFNLHADTVLCNEDTLQLVGPSGTNYQYQWHNNSNQQRFTAVGKGTYRLKVTDQNKCVFSDTVNITTGITNYDLLYDPSPVCQIIDTLSIIPKLKGGWFTPNAFIDSLGVVTINNTAVGNNLIHYTYQDQIGCLNPDSTYLTVYALPDASLKTAGPLCENEGSEMILPNTNSGGDFSGGLYISQTGSFNPGVAKSGVHKVYYTFTNANTCTSVDSTWVTVDSIPDATLMNAGPFCLSAPTYTISPNKNTGGTFSGGGYISATGTFNPLSAGSGVHKIYYAFTDGNGCSNNDSTSVQVDSLPDASIIQAADYCLNVDSFVVLPTVNNGGVFSGIGITSSGTFFPSNSGSGNHKIFYSFTDGNGCSSVDSSVVTIDTLPDASIVAGGPYCLNAGIQKMVPSKNFNGTFSGGSYIDSNGDFDPNLSGPGSHKVYYSFTDAKGCTSQDSTTILVDTIPNTSIINNSPFCENSGIQTINSAHQTGGNFSGGSFINAAGNFDPSISGKGQHKIFFEFTDGNGCTTKDSTTIEIDSIPDASLIAQAPLCNNNDSVQIVPVYNSGGTFSGGSYVSNIGWFNPWLTAPGAHKVYYSFTDGNGCGNNDSLAINVNAVPDASINLAGPFCQNDGNQNITPTTNSGGLFSGSSITSAGVFDPLNAIPGPNKVYYDFTDNNGCQNIDSTYIVVDTVPDASMNKATQACVNAPVFDITAVYNSGGTFSGGSYISNTGQFSPKVATVGLHVVYYSFIDSKGCQSIDSQFVKVDSFPNAAIVPPADICVNGGNTSILPLENFGGTFSGGAFITNDGIFDPSIAGVGDFKLYYTVLDNNLCNNVDSTSIHVNGLPDASINDAGPLCENNNTYTLTPKVNTGGTFSGGMFINAAGEFDPAVAKTGTHKVFYQYTDGNNCVNLDSNLVIVNEIPDASVTPAGPFCQNGGDQQLAAQVNPGGIFYMDQGIISPDGLLDPMNTGSGQHKIYYSFTDLNGCNHVDSTSVNILPIPDASISVVQEKCPNHKPFKITPAVNANGLFSGGPFIATNGTFNPALAQIGINKVYYTYTAFGSPSCSNTDSVEVIINPLPSNQITQSDFSGCEPLSVDFQCDPNDSLIWNISGDLTNTLYQTNEFSYTFDKGDYSFELVSVTPTGCRDTVNSNLTVFALPIATFSYTPRELYISNPKVNFTDESIGAINSWSWDFGDLNGSGEQNPTHIYDNSGQFIVNLEIVDTNSCVNVTMQEVEVQDELLLYIPNAFSPNNDGINDVFSAAGVGFNKITYNIFNRWGEKLYVGVDEGWNGVYKGKDVQHGVYMYFIEVIDTKGTYHSYSGSVKLLR